MSPSASQSPTESPRRRRPGRARRWLVRPLVWLGVLLVTLVALAWWTLQTPWAQERARAELVTRLSAALGTPVTVDALELSVLPPTLTLSGVTIADVDPSYPPFLEANRLEIAAGLTRGPRWQIHLQSLLAERPVVRLRHLGNGVWNLPRPERKRRDRRFELHIGTVHVQEGLLVLDEQALPLDLTARDVLGRFVGDGPDAARGEARVGEVELRLPQGRPYLGSVTARLRIWETGLEILESSIDGPHLLARAHGTVGWDDGTRVDLSVDASGDGRVLDSIGYLEERIRGRFDARVQVLAERSTWGVRGELNSPELHLFDWPLTDLRGSVAVDANAAHVDVAEARFGGGRVRGGFRIDLGDEQRASRLSVDVRGVHLEPLLQGLGIPVENILGEVEGELEYRFALLSPEAGDGWADLEVAALAGRGPGVPLSGSVPVRVRDGVVHVGDLLLASDRQRLRGGGSYDLAERSGRFELAVVSTAIGELRHLFPFDTESDPPLWLPRQGRGELTARLEVAPERVTTQLQLDLASVAAPGLTADRVAGTLALTESGVGRMRLDLHRDGAALLVAGSVPFEDGVPGAPPFDLEVSAAGWPLDDVAPWIPMTLPLGGRVTGALRLAGRLEEPDGALTATVEDVELGPMRSGRLDLALQFDPAAVRVEQAVWRTPAGAVRAAGDYAVASEALDFTLRSEPLAVDRPPLTQLGTSGLEGNLALEARIVGTLGEPRIEVSLDGDDLRLEAGPKLPPVQARLLWTAGALEVHADLLDLLSVEGGGELTAESAHLDLRVTGQRLRTVAQAAGLLLPEGLDGDLAGVVTLRRSVAEPTPRLDLVLDRLHLRYGPHTLTNLDPVEARLERGALHIDSLYLGTGEEGDELFVGGEITLGEPWPLDLHLQSSVPLTWLELLVPQLEVSGQLHLLATVGGSLRDPRFNGQGEVSDGRLIVEGFPQSVEAVTGLILLDPDAIVVDRLDGRFGGGRLRVAGSLRPVRDQPLGWGYTFQVEANDVQLRYPADWRLRGDADLLLVSTVGGRELTGVVQLERATYLRDVRASPAELLRDFLRRQPHRLAEVDETLRGTELQVQVVGQEALQVRNNLARLTGDLDLMVRGTLARPVLFGTVSTEPDSLLFYGGNEYRVERAELIFADPYRIDPYVDLVADATVHQYDITLQIDGSLQRPNVRFSSNPPLADLDVLALVTTGSPLAPGEELTAEVGAAERLLYGQAAHLVAERVGTLFGVDRFRIDPLTTGSGDIAEARVTVGQRLSRDFLVTYSYDPSTTAVNIFQVEWQIDRQLSLLLTQNGDESYAVDARWTRRF